MAAKASVKGGTKMAKVLADIGRKMGAAHVRVGFLETAKYPPFRTQGTPPNRKTRKVPVIPVAQVAFWNEFGTITSPPRPFFREMIAKESPQWGKRVAKTAKATGYDGQQTLELVGEGIAGQLRQSIINKNDPPNSKRTIWNKNGASKPLVDEGIMLGAVNYEVVKGTS